MRSPHILRLLFRSVRSYRNEAKLNSIIARNRLVHYSTTDWCRSELRARDLLRRAEGAASWMPTPIYPVGGAAGPLLMYLLIRFLTEFPLQRILELGAGQSTRVLDAWSKASGGSLVSFEHDASWAESVRAMLTSPRAKLLCLPLVESMSPYGPLNWYASPPNGELPENGFDLVIVDGPVGAHSLSRAGIVERIPDWMRPDWLLLWDDLDRPSDLQSFALLIQRLRHLGVAHDHLLLDGDRTIGLIATPRYSSARFMW